MDTESEGLRTSATPGSLLLGIEKDIETPLDDALLVATRPGFNMRVPYYPHQHRLQTSVHP